MKRNRTVRTVLIAAAAACGLVAAGTASATTEPVGTTGDTSGDTGGAAAPAPADVEQPDLTVGIIPINDILPLPAGLTDGTFEAAGLTVEQVEAAGGAAIIPGVVSGDYDIGFSNVTSILKAVEQGLDLRIIASGPYVGSTPEEDFSGLSTMDPEITELTDLEGKTISVNTLLGAPEIAVRETLEAVGVTDFDLIEIPFPETTAALEAGTVDAAFQVEPFVGQAQRAGATLLASPFSTAQPGMLVAAWFTTADFIEENPNTVAAFAAAMNASNVHVQEDRDFANEVLVSFTPTPDIEAAAATILPVFKDTIDVESLATSVELATKWGLLEEEIDVESIVVD